MRRLIAGLALVAGCAGPPPAKGANVVLITLDTVRADHLGAYGYGDARTPVIDGLAERGALFETAVSVAPLTVPTHTSIMTGLYPYDHGVRDNGSAALAADRVTLAERFAESGYDTAAIVSALVLDSKYGLDQGFEVYDDDLYAGPVQKMFMFKEVPADQTVDKAVKLLEGELREPFFLWIHLFDAHADYEPPPPWDVVFADQPYDGEIAFIDKQLGRLFGTLRSEGLEDRTVVALTADHGDSLGDHGEYTHGIFIYRSTTHIPLIVAGPGIGPARIEGVVSQVDLAPTLTELVGVEPLGTDGASLRAVLSGRGDVPSRDGVYVESMNPRLQFGWHELRAVDAGEAKYIDAPRPELYDLEADPVEAHNLLDAAQPPSSGLADVLGKWVAGDDLSALDGTALDAQTAKMLEEMGYTADLGGPDPGGDLPDPKDVAWRWVELQRCQGLVRKEAHLEARDCLVKLLESDPRNWAGLMSLASTYRKIGQPDKALEVLQGALSRDPKNVKVLISLSLTMEALARPEDAKLALVRATEAAPGDPEPWTALGDLCQRLGDGPGSVDAYGEALRRDEIYVTAYIGLANTFHRSGDSERALRYLEEATRLEPTNHTAWYNLGVVYDALARTSEAEAAYRKAIEIDPTHALTHNNLGSLYKRQERRAEAEAEFRKALDLDPDGVEARYNLATLLLDEKPDAAAVLLRDVVARQPDLVPARHNLAVALVRLELYDEALEHYRWLVEHTKNPWATYLAMADIEARREHTAEARRLVAKAVEIGGTRAREAVTADADLKGL